MFPTFDVPQHAETVGMRKARKARERDGGVGARRMSTSTTSDRRNRLQLTPTLNHSDAASICTTRSRAASTKAPSAFGFWRKKDRDVTEILDFPMMKKDKLAALSKKNTGIKTTEIAVPSPTSDSPPMPSPVPSLHVRPHTSHVTSASSMFPASLTSISQSMLASTDIAYTSDEAPPPLPRALWHEAPSTPPPSRGLPSIPPQQPIPTSQLPPLPSHISSPLTQPLPQPRLRSKPSLKSLHQLPSRGNSTYSNVSGGTSSMRSSAVSDGRSIFTSSHHPYADTISEVTDYDQPSIHSYRIVPLHYQGPSPLSSPIEISHPRHSQTSSLHPESVRSSSRMTERRGPSVALFARALSKMESAGPRIIAARLAEEWDGLDDDDESAAEVSFEKRCWALTAYSWLTQGKQLQSPAHESLLAALPSEGRRILHLHGSLADGWTLAARYPACTVYSLSSANTPAPTTHPAPLNHHALYTPSPASALPFPDAHFDAVVSRSVSASLDNDEWARAFHDWARVLKPGARLEILSIDPVFNRAGPLLRNWADAHVVSRLEAHGKSMMPSDTVIDTMGIVGLQNVKRVRIALPAVMGEGDEAGRLLSLLGRHMFQDLYRRFVKTCKGEKWFWDGDVGRECERLGPKMVLTISCGNKVAHGEEFRFD